jgi:hypothetical protein
MSGELDRSPIPVCLAHRSIEYTGISNPLVIETLALRDAVSYVVDCNFDRVLFEVDCAELVGLWQIRLEERLVIRPILDDLGVA